MILSLPARPMTSSRPVAPSRVFAPASPRRRSAKEVPLAFSNSGTGMNQPPRFHPYRTHRRSRRTIRPTASAHPRRGMRTFGWPQLTSVILSVWLMF